MARSKQKISFEKALEKLESIVKKMEGGELPLEESMKLFQEGIELSGVCRELLAEAEYKVEHLLKGRDETGYGSNGAADLTTEHDDSNYDAGNIPEDEE